jgi:CheY-like chemotaxis protein
MDGIETVKHLQEEFAKRVPAVIMVTAYGREEAMGSAEQSGVAVKSVLTKPVTPSTLLEAIGEALGTGIVTETRAHVRADQNTEAMAKLAGARVLLVEDNDLNQELARDLLQQANVEVVIANNGREALDILARDGRFDGVLMDCQMPVMDGYEATRAIRKNPATSTLPIVAMTANAMAGDREKVIEAGMLDHIAKPFNVHEMFGTLAKWIRPAHAAPATAIATATSANGADSTGLPPLPGIDVKAGLATTMNNAKLYLRLLAKFRESQRDFAAMFRDARAGSDPTAAARAAHTLKGTAANIGAKAVQAAAGNLEQACMSDAPAGRVDELLKATLGALDPVIEVLAEFLDSRAEQPAAEPRTGPKPESAKVRTLTERLETLLRDSDTEAADVLDELERAIGGGPLATGLKQVGRAIAEFDFDTAIEALKKLGK